MRTTRPTLLPALLLLAAPAALGQSIVGDRKPVPAAQDSTAATFPRHALSADTAFVLHVDVQRLLGSTWLEAARAVPELREGLENEDELRELKEEWGVDPFRDLLSVTVFGQSDDEEDVAVVVRTTDAVDQALRKLREIDGHRRVTHEGLELDAWSEGGADDRVFAQVLGRAGSDLRWIVLAPNADNVAGAVHSLRDGSDRLATPDAHLTARPRAGAYVYLEVGAPLSEVLDDTPASRVTEKAKRLVIQLGEGGDDVWLDARVDATDGTAAREIADVVNGARSMLKLSGVLEELPLALQDVADGLRAEVHGTSVRLGFQMRKAAVREAVRELQDR